MAKLAWGDRPPWYDLGVDRGVLYLDGTAVPWDGLISVEEKPVGETVADHYFEGNRICISQTAGEFEGVVTAYTYPDVFSEYNGFGPHETYRRFGFSYRTQLGLDKYQVHLVYGALVQDTDRAWRTINSRAEPSNFAWDFVGDPVDIPNARPAAHLKLEMSRDSSVLNQIEDILYGTDTTEPRMPSPEELLEAYEAATTLRVTMYTDGSYSASGPDEMVAYGTDGTIFLSAPSLMMFDADRFALHSY